MANNTEIELKFFVNRNDLEGLLNSGLLHIQENSKKVRRLVSSYYDTEDFAFKANGIAYRVRDKGDGSYEATVKTSRKSAAGLSERMELNLPLEKNGAVLEGFEELGLEQSLRLLAPNGVCKLFTVDVERTTYILEQGEARIELAIDLGKIKARGKKSVPIDEIELELLEGDKPALLQVAALIAKQIPLFVEKSSKYARGLAMLGLESDIVISKEKMRGPIRRELMKMINFHGDGLLELQNYLNGKGSLKEEKLQALRKKLCFLGSYVELAKNISSAPDKYEELVQLAGQWLKLVEQWLLVAELQKEWDKLLELDPGLAKSKLLKQQLEQEQEKVEQELRKLSCRGQLTYLVYMLLIVVDGEELHNEDFLLSDTVVATLCNRLQQELLELGEQEKRTFTQELRILSTMLCLSRSVKGKRFGHLTDGWKKQEKVMLDLAIWQQELLKLQSWLKVAEDKLLVRDLGILYGSLL